jgi:LPXTG-motif cell wall-anchored protein
MHRSAPVLAVISAAIAAAAASAHVTAVPPFVEAGSEATLALDVPNERRGHAMTALAVTLPRSMELRGAEPRGAWRASTDGRTATWTGGTLEPGATGVFALSAEAPARSGRVELAAEQRFADGRRVRWDVRLEVTPAPATGDDQRFGLALLIGFAGLAAVVAGLVLSYRRRTRSLQER